MWYGTHQRYCGRKRKYLNEADAWVAVRGVQASKGEAEAFGLLPYPCPDNDLLPEYQQHWHIGHMKYEDLVELRRAQEPQLRSDSSLSEEAS